MGPKPPHLAASYRAGAAAGSNSINRVNVDSIKCHICSKVKSRTEYANRQLLKLPGYNQYAPANGKEKPVCKSCTPKQVQELHCKMCGKTKSTKFFNKTQRHDPDNARCKKCVQVCEDRKVGAEEHVDSDNYTDGEGTDSDEDIDIPKGELAVQKKEVKDTSDSDDQLDMSESEKQEKPKRGRSSAKSPQNVSSVSQFKVETPSLTSGANTPAYTTAVTTPASSSGIVSSGSNEKGEWQTVNSRATKKNAFRSNAASSYATPGDSTPSRSALRWNKHIKTELPAKPEWFKPGGQPSMVKKKPAHVIMDQEPGDSEDEV